MYSRWLFIVPVLALVSCASRPPAFQEQGWASYVADYYTGRKTSSGDIYYPQAYTAAHPTLPFGTIVTVKNVLNNRTVNVTINDRFPYYPGRVINLSSAAAQHIQIPYMQMGQVQVTAKSVPNSGYAQPASGYGGGYATQPNYGYAASPPPRQAAYQQPAAAPKRSFFQSSTPARSGGAPNAPVYQGGSTPPPGLNTF